MPRQLTGQFQHTHNVNLNGAEMLAKLTPVVRDLVVEEARAVIGRVFREQLPDAGVRVE